MLYLLAQFLEQYYHPFQVFHYLTLRSILSSLTALLIALLVGPVMIRKLTYHQVGQNVRDDGPQTHLKKAGTPTMGGALILTAITTSILFALGGFIQHLCMVGDFGNVRFWYHWLDR